MTEPKKYNYGRVIIIVAFAIVTAVVVMQPKESAPVYSPVKPLKSVQSSGAASPVCALGDKACADQRFLASGGDARELAEMALVNQRFKQAIHCPPNDAAHPGRCDGTDGPDEARNFNAAVKRLMDEARAAHLHACQLGYALHGTCN